jgi:hypothetical protein
MQKSIPATVCFLCLFTFLIISSVSANDGHLIHKNFHPTNPVSSTQRSWLGNIWQDIGDFFSHLFGHDHAAPGYPGGKTAPGGTTAPGGSPAPAAPGSPSVPINGGIGLLLVAGIGLGVKMARDRYKPVPVNA